MRYIINVVFDWDIEKNKLLKKTRHISFEQIIVDIEAGNVLDILENPNKQYKNQNIIIVDHEEYAYVVPAVKVEKGYFLKTIFPSRKYTMKYLINRGDKL